MAGRDVQEATPLGTVLPFPVLSSRGRNIVATVDGFVVARCEGLSPSGALWMALVQGRCFAERF